MAPVPESNETNCLSNRSSSNGSISFQLSSQQQQQHQQQQQQQYGLNLEIGSHFQEVIDDEEEEERTKVQCTRSTVRPFNPMISMLQPSSSQSQSQSSPQSASTSSSSSSSSSQSPSPLPSPISSSSSSSTSSSALIILSSANNTTTGHSGVNAILTPSSSLASLVSSSQQTTSKQQATSKQTSSEETTSSIFGVPLPSQLNSPLFKYLFCASGLFLFYLLHAVALEYLFTEHLVSGFFLTLFQFTVYMCCAAIERFRMGQFSVRNASLRQYFLMSFFSVASMGLAYQALEYVTFPTQVIFKSCKLLAVMAAGVCITGRQYSLSEYVAALFLVSGLTTLSLSLSSFSSSSSTASAATTVVGSTSAIFGDGLFGLSVNLTGVALLTLALFADAFVGNMQERVLSKNKATTAELVFYTHLLGIVWIVAISLFSGQLFQGFQFCIQQPHSVVVMLLYSILGYFGINFFMLMMKEFGVLVAVTTTTVRKVVSLMLSFILFPKTLSSSFVLAAFLVFFGVALHIENKNRDAIRSLFRNPLRRRRRSDPKKQQV